MPEWLTPDLASEIARGALVTFEATQLLALGGDVTRAPYWITTYLVVGLLYWIVAFGLSRWSERTGTRGPTIGLVGGA